MPCSSYLLESGTVRRGNRLRKGEDSSEVTGSSLGRKDNVRRGLKKKHSGNEQSLALCGMKSQVGKGRAATPPPGTTWSWPCPSSVSPRFQDAPLMLTSGSAHPTLRKLRLRDSCDKAWGVGWGKDFNLLHLLSPQAGSSLDSLPPPSGVLVPSWLPGKIYVCVPGGAFPRGHSSSLPIFQFCQGRKKSQGWRPWGPTSCWKFSRPTTASLVDNQVSPGKLHNLGLQ